VLQFAPQAAQAELFTKYPVPQAVQVPITVGQVIQFLSVQVLATQAAFDKTKPVPHAKQSNAVVQAVQFALHIVQDEASTKYPVPQAVHNPAPAVQVVQ
jgi:hypothetical protein